ncbi:GDP-mannose 4,6-dehydratase [mine drainage metagenome]|uniref:GDP-mannose 4,6-dehydratase n=1 Tax=mine drainage metagenome TaxID=410659 RepID=A0A1J5S6B1_9ZZZZ
MTTALITGISGQDGSYLAELLLERGYRVVGTSRDARESAKSLPLSLSGKVELVDWDLKDQKALEDILSQYLPTELYNFASYTSGSGMFDDPVEIGEINGLAVVKILEAIRLGGSQVRFCQASSREIFGATLESPQTERTPLDPRSPYGAAKQYADSMIRIYRKHYGLFACSAILFNHESPRRGLKFVTRKITHEAAKIKVGQASELRLGNLDTVRDWGFAGDFVNAMRLMLQQPKADDYVVATGEVHSVREFCECAFGHLGLDYRDFVREDSASFRPSEPAPLVGDISKARRLLGWKPQVGFSELVTMMVDADLRMLAN